MPTCLPGISRQDCNRMHAIAEAVFAAQGEQALDDQAGPAYLRGLSLSRWLFWRRLLSVGKLIPPGGKACLDFGCGLGLMLPHLAKRFDQVYAIDLVPESARNFLTQWRTAYGEPLENVRVFDNLESTGIRDGQLDMILALDVLEHVDDLEGLLERMQSLLAVNGTLIVCGPTENWLYRFGRRLVGFSGEYHHRDLYDIERVMRRFFDVTVARRLYPPLPLFVVLQGKRAREKGDRRI